MLADQINETSGIVYPDGTSQDMLLAPLRDRLADAKLYVFGAEAVQMAANVAMGRPTSIVAALPWVRLPAPATWIEFSNLDMRQAMAALGSPNLRPDSAAVAVLRTGFLLRQAGGDLVMDYVHADRAADGRTFVDLAPVRLRFALDPDLPTPETAPDGRNETRASGRVRRHLKLVSEDPKEAAAEASLRERFLWGPHPDMAAAAAALAGVRGRDFVREVEENQAFDAWRMFQGFVLPSLILLNCRNAVEAEEISPSAKLNRSRLARGRAALRPHALVRMHLTAARRRKAAAGAGARGAVASAFVVGHFKVRRPGRTSPGGVFWWSPHVRLGIGDPVPRPTVVDG